MKTYEAMLLVDPTVAAKEWNRIGEEVDRIVKRHGGAVLQVTRFGERKLAGFSSMTISPSSGCSSP